MIPRVSIIIPCKEIDDNVKKCVRECHKLDYPDFNVWVIDDDLKPGMPAEKRDWAAQFINEGIIAFIDSDAYPPKDWLKKGVKYLQKYQAVCGPGIIPPGSDINEQISDFIYQLLPSKCRVIPTKPHYEKDFPTFNMMMWKYVFDRVGGFGCKYLTGEDSILCEKIGGLMYLPDLFIYHKRRPIFLPLLKQVATYGWHRGHFFRKGVGTSRKVKYLVPSLCLLLSLLLLLFWLL